MERVGVAAVVVRLVDDDAVLDDEETVATRETTLVERARVGELGGTQAVHVGGLDEPLAVAGTEALRAQMEIRRAVRPKVETARGHREEREEKEDLLAVTRPEACGVGERRGGCESGASACRTGCAARHFSGRSADRQAASSRRLPTSRVEGRGYRDTHSVSSVRWRPTGACRGPWRPRRTASSPRAPSLTAARETRPRETPGCGEVLLQASIFFRTRKTVMNVRS